MLRLAALVVIAASSVCLGAPGLTGISLAQPAPSPTPTTAVATSTASAAPTASPLPAPPTPAGPPGSISGCGRSGPAVAGGRTTGISAGETVLEVTLPPGSDYFTLPMGLFDPALFVCHVRSNSSVTIDVATGREVGRSPGDPAAGPVLDQIVASARLTAVPVTGPAPVRAPSTGDGGLRRR